MSSNTNAGTPEIDDNTPHVSSQRSNKRPLFIGTFAVIVVGLLSFFLGSTLGTNTTTVNTATTYVDGLSVTQQLDTNNLPTVKLIGAPTIARRCLAAEIIATDENNGNIRNGNQSDMQQWCSGALNSTPAITGHTFECESDLGWAADDMVLTSTQLPSVAQVFTNANFDRACSDDIAVKEATDEGYADEVGLRPIS